MTDHHHDHGHHLEDEIEELTILDEQARLTRLIVHLGTLVRRGGRVEEQHGYRAVVSMPRKGPTMVPNVLMAAAGVALFLWVGEALFLLGAGVALLGWHKKLVAGAQYVRLHVRVDDVGEITERELEPA